MTPGGELTSDQVMNDALLVEAPTPQPTQSVNVFGEVNGVSLIAGLGSASEIGYQQHTFVDEGYDSGVCVDASGKWLVFTSTRNSEHADLYLQAVDGTAVTQLTSDGSDAAYPCFSPDGKQIAFSSTRSGTWQIWTMEIDGHGAVQVTSGPGQSVHPSFSPDGTRLVYSSLSPRGQQWELWTVNLQTSEKRMIGYGLFPSWSPDRNVDRIAYQRARQRGSRWFSLWTLDLVNGEAHRVTEVAMSSTAAILSPSWSPDGTQIAFSTVIAPSRGDAVGGSSGNGRTDIWTVNADGTGRHRLSDGVGSSLTPCWSADNRIFFISDRSGTDCVWSVNAQGPNVRTANAPATQPAKATASASVSAEPELQK